MEPPLSNQANGYNRQAGTGRFWLLCIPLTILLCGLYFFSFDEKSDCTFEIDDGLNYSRNILLAEKRFHPHHLLFHPLGLLSYRSLSLLSDRMTPLQSLRLLNAAAGALICLMAARAIFLFTGNLRSSILSMLGLGFSRGLWLYSSIGETVSPAGFFQTAAFLAASTPLFFSCLQGPLPLALLAVAATMIRQDSLILLPAYLLIIALRGWGLRKIVAFILIFSLGVTLCYGAAWIMGEDYLYNKEGRDFAQWITLYKYYNPESASLKNLSPENLLLSARKLSHVLGLGMRSRAAWMVISPFKAGWGRIEQTVDLAIQILLAAAWVFVLIMIVLTAREVFRRYRVLFLGALAWLFIREAFNIWAYNEYSLVFHVISAVPVFIIFGLSFAVAQSGEKRLLPHRMVTALGTALVILLFLSSLLTVIALRQESFYERARVMKRVLRRGDLYITREFREQFLFSEILGVHCIHIPPEKRKESYIPQLESTYRQGGRVFISAMERKRWERFEARWEAITKEEWPHGYELVPVPELKTTEGEIVAKRLIKVGGPDSH